MRWELGRGPGPALGLLSHLALALSGYVTAGQVPSSRESGCREGPARSQDFSLSGWPPRPDGARGWPVWVGALSTGPEPVLTEEVVCDLQRGPEPSPG